ncbi:MAG TPA: LacI family transcriptional regulator [Candidatus Lachnoclostridium stercorigallinarum]|uniref:LacI family transcriptional regulator n=1 Tax=Candidatus Lachnoclostridium stercorigallinarum TaxID=2838634 RepID=A0A9D2GFZ0_9FIRM|nr:LacI family transcriptional regulator [Candidatus Lachnoclostridium stercorigallinarum]
MKPNMKDVANHAGVSVATVSHVINHTRFVSEETQQKVLDSIQALGYVPDPTARSFKTGRKNLIGIIVPDIANPVWAVIIEEVESVLAKDGYKLLIVNTKETESREMENLKLLSSGLVDGLIIATTLTDFSQIRAAVPDGFPMVFIDRQLPGCTCDTIIPQDYPAIYDGIRRMIEQGHHRIGFITGLMRLSTSVNRLNAYRDALTECGIPVDETLIEQGNSLSFSAVPLVQNLLEKRCTAIAVSNNVMLDDVLYYLRTVNMEPGKDVLLLGQTVEGRKNYFARNVQMILQPSKEIGHTAGVQILERIRTPDLPVRNTVLYSALL